jgi:hypothetical protein
VRAVPLVIGSLANPGFELAANHLNPDRWAPANSKATRSSVVKRHGSYAMRYFATDNTSCTIYQVVPSVAAGPAYHFSSWVNIPTTTDTFSFRIRVDWRNASNSIIGSSVVKTYTSHTGGKWDETAADLVAPAGTTNAVVWMVVSSLNTTIYVDDFALWS